MAADESGTWRRLLTDPDTGQLSDLSPDTYRPSQRLRDFVAVRDGVCVFPGCNQPAYRCEYEHTVPFGQGGGTCRKNGALAWKRHNLCKINTGWRYFFNDDNSITWTTDTGHTYTTYPPTRWPQPDDPPPPAPTGPTQQEREAGEDIDYVDLILRWRTELKAARSLSDGARAANARRALTEAHQQRGRQLAHRTNPNYPPFDDNRLTSLGRRS